MPDVAHRLPAACGWPSAIAVLGLLLGGCLSEQEAPVTEPEVRPVRVQEAVVKSLEETTSYAGAVQPRYEAPLAFRLGGKVITRRVEIGDAVVAGDELMRLDPGGQELVEQTLEAQLAAAKAELEQARTELNRARDLRRRKLISTSDYERQETLFNTAKARYEQAQSQLAEAELQADYRVLTADRSGVITEALVQVGQVVAAGQPVLNLALPEEKEVVIHIPENRLDEFKTVEEVDITLWAAPEREYRGRVREVSPVADPVTRTYAVKITVLDSDPAMHLGMTANVQVRRVLAGPAMRLPRTALVEKDRQPAVWVVDPAEQTVQLAPITLGELRGEDFIVRDGLAEGQLVVTAGVQKLHPGQPVRLLEQRP